ncbi:MAG: hypothetical protein AB1689_08400 [Thermodesulfobacteriota bacterium]
MLPSTPRGRAALAAPTLALALACAAAASAAEAPCARYAAKAVRTGKVPDGLPELSGIAASRRHPGVYWAHNDSNNDGMLFAIDASGKLLARFPLRGLRPRDAEDVAVGPCGPDDESSCIYLADTGDNLLRRKEVWIGRVEEPEALDGRVLDVSADAFRYPDGARNTESLLVDPRSARLYVVTKSVDGLGEVYRLDGLEDGRVGRAVPVATLPPPATLARMTTAADQHPGGERVLLRTYSSVWELRRPGARSLEEVFAAQPVQVTNAAQMQGEGVTYTADGRGYVLAAEGDGSPIYRVDCAGGER